MGDTAMRTPSYKSFTYIEDDSRLAKAFNEVLRKLNLVRITSAPRTFEKSNEEDQRQTASIFYETCLWELYMHGVVGKLKEWRKIIRKYLAEFRGSWKYYALPTRTSNIREYGGEEKDYNEDGSIRTDVTDEELGYYDIIGDLVDDDSVDIVQETKPEDFTSLCNALEAGANISITDIIKNVSGVDIPLYKKDEQGEMVQMSFAERVLLKANEQCEAEDLACFVLTICQAIQLLLQKIRSLDKFKDNKEELEAILKAVEYLLDMDVERLNAFK